MTTPVRQPHADALTTQHSARRTQNTMLNQAGPKEGAGPDLQLSDL